MTNKKRFLMSLTVVSFLTVTGFVIGCDSDDGPKVTPPAPSGGGEPSGGENGDGENGDGENDDGENGDGENGDGENDDEIALPGSSSIAYYCMGFDNLDTYIGGENGLRGFRNTCSGLLNVGLRCSATGTQRLRVYRLSWSPRSTPETSYGPRLIPPLSCGGERPEGFSWHCPPDRVPVVDDEGIVVCRSGTGINPVHYSGGGGSDGGGGSGGGSSREQLAAEYGSQCLDLSGGDSRNSCTNHELNVGVRCSGDTSFRNIIRYPIDPQRRYGGNQAGCSSGITQYSACTAPARPRASGSSQYSCYYP